MRRLRLACLALALVLPSAAFAADAVDTVRGFYGPPVWNPLEAEDASGLSVLTGPALDLFTKNLALQAEQEPGCVDFVVTASGQDYDDAEIAKTLKLDERGTTAEGDTLVAAQFRAFPGTSSEPETEVVWTMREEGGAWKVADISNAKDGWTLSEMSCE